MTPSTEGIAAPYASLSHSHLNQVLKHASGRLGVGVQVIADMEDRASLELLRRPDERFAKACDEGIMWETLGHNIATEDDRGCEIIQAAVNSNHAIALAYHEMVLIAPIVQVVLEVFRECGIIPSPWRGKPCW